MMRWLSPLVFLRSLSMFALNGLMGLGRIGVRTLLIAIIAAVALALYILLIPHHGWKGAVAGTLSSEVLLVVAAWIALLVFQRRADRDIVETTPADLTQSVS